MFDKNVNVQRITVLLLIFLLITFYSYSSKPKHLPDQQIKTKIVVDTVLIDTKIPDFSRQVFYEYLHQCNLKFPRVVFCQALLESQFNSELFRVNKNLFGMTKAGKRQHVQSISRKKYAVYRSWQESVIDYALFQANFLPQEQKIKTEKQYIQRLNKYYAADPEYDKKLTKLLVSVDWDKLDQNIE